MENQRIPTPGSELIAPLLKCSALIAAAKLGIFKALTEKPLTIPEIARIAGASEAGVASLVEALVALGYAERSGDKYGIGSSARAWLTPASPVDFTPVLLAIGDLWFLFENLAQTVRLGHPQQGMIQFLIDHPETGRLASQMLKGEAQLVSKLIAQAVPMPDNARRLLDLGGSHGLYSIAFCREHPDLKAVVFDMPFSLADTGENITSAGMADRVSIQQGNFLTDDIGHGYDVILCFNILGIDVEGDKRLFPIMVKALNPGGLVLIITHWIDPSDTISSLFNLMLLAAYGSHTYSREEVSRWLTESGFTDIRRIDVPATWPVSGGQISILTAVKP